MPSSLIIFFTTVTLSHGAFLYFASRRHGDAYRDFRRKLWVRHYAVNGALWLLLLVAIVSLQFTALRVATGFYGELAGIALCLCGIALSWKSMSVLGLDNAMGRRFFFPEESAEIRSSVYGFLNNPMYDGFLLVFMGLGLWLGIAEDVSLAFASFILLNVVLASVENYRVSWRIF